VRQRDYLTIAIMLRSNHGLILSSRVDPGAIGFTKPQLNLKDNIVLRNREESWRLAPLYLRIAWKYAKIAM
jgi:hypothetical protein